MDYNEIFWWGRACPRTKWLDFGGDTDQVVGLNSSEACDLWSLRAWSGATKTWDAQQCWQKTKLNPNTLWPVQRSPGKQKFLKTFNNKEQLVILTKEWRVESDAKLSNQVAGFLLRTGLAEFCQELTCTRLCNCAKIFDEVVLRHADAGISDMQNVIVFIRLHTMWKDTHLRLNVQQN